MRRGELLPIAPYNRSQKSHGTCTKYRGGLITPATPPNSRLPTHSSYKDLEPTQGEPTQTNRDW